MLLVRMYAHIAYFLVGISKYLLSIHSKYLVPNLQPPITSCRTPLGDAGNQDSSAPPNLLTTLDVEAKPFLGVFTEGHGEDCGEAFHQVTARAVRGSMLKKT